MPRSHRTPSSNLNSIASEGILAMAMVVRTKKRLTSSGGGREESPGIFTEMRASEPLVWAATKSDEIACTSNMASGVELIVAPLKLSKNDACCSADFRPIGKKWRAGADERFPFECARCTTFCARPVNATFGALSTIALKWKFVSSAPKAAM